MSIRRLDNQEASEIGSRVTDRVERALAGLRFGSVEFIVHEGQLAQIERRELLTPVPGGK